MDVSAHDVRLFLQGAAVALFADGSAYFLQEDIEPIAMRALVTRSESDISSWTP